MVRYVYGALRDRGVPDEVIKGVIKALIKWAVKSDLEDKEVTFDLELSDDFTKLKIKNLRIWEPTKTIDGVFELTL